MDSIENAGSAMDDHQTELPEGVACAQCGYSIHALTVDRCPECGTAFNRKHILAHMRGAVIKRLFDKRAAKMLAPPPWWTTVLALAATLACFSSDSIRPNVNGHSPPMPATLMFSIAAAAFFLKALDHRNAPFQYDMTGAPTRRLGANWILLPAFLVLFYSAAVTDLIARVAFVASLPQMNTLAKKVASTQWYTPDQRVGFYDAVQMYRTPDGMTFRLKGHPDAGFVYTTTGKRPDFRNDTEPMGGGWYAVPGE